MFKLIPYISRAGLLACVVAAALLAFWYRQTAIGDLLAQHAQQQLALNHALANTVWPEFEPFITATESLSGEQLRAHPESARLRGRLAAQLGGTGLDEIAIYNLRGRTIFASNAAQIGVDQGDNQHVLAARDGLLSGELIRAGASDPLDQVVADRDTFVTYTLLRRSGGGEPVAIFAIGSDATPLTAQIAQTQARVVGGVVLLLAALYGALLLIARRADSVLAQQEFLRAQTDMQLRRHALTFDHINDSVVITELSGSIIDCNPATERIFGYARDEVLGNNLGLWYRPADRNALRAAMIDAVAQGGRWTGEIPFVRKNGVRGICEVVIVPLGDTGEQHLGRIWVGHDITERARAQELLVEARDAAEAASQAKSLFLANMSHELRTPLTAIIGYGDLLQYEAQQAGQSALLPALAHIKGAAHHLLALINDILDLSKIETGDVELELREFSIADVVADVVAQLQPLIVQNHNTLEVLCPPDVGLMTADQSKVRQVLLNLLGNAAKFTAQGQITLTAAREMNGRGDWVRFGVADTGIGITREQLQQLFEPFTQGDSSTTRKYGGAGLGLALSRRFCELMGGHISVASEPGLGSTFIVYLPATYDEVQLARFSK
jgi:PAS domain S-box-containing protein